ncbi:MAG: DUF4391 domain-containing protein [Parabacteroides sp.]
MYGLPISTEIKRQLPKKAIYAKFAFNASQRERFDADVARMDIVAVVSPSTVSALGAGTEVKEFYVVAVQLKRKEYEVKNLSLLFRLIPQKMVLALQFEQEIRFAIEHTQLITSAWMPTEEAQLPLLGLNIDTAWENLVKSIGQITVEAGHTLAEQIAVNEQRAKLSAQIATLKRKMANERQPRKKRAIYEEIKKLVGTQRVALE